MKFDYLIIFFYLLSLPLIAQSNVPYNSINCGAVNNGSNTNGTHLMSTTGESFSSNGPQSGVRLISGFLALKVSLAEAKITVSQTDTLNFDQVTLNTPSQKSFIINNTGEINLTVISIISSDTAFKVSPNSNFTVAPNSPQQINVTFTPRQEITYTANLVINHNGGGSAVTIPLKGYGTAVAQPVINLSTALLSFGAVKINNSNLQTFTVRNDGQAPLIVSSLTATSPGSFTLNPSTSFTLTTGQQKNIDVTFQPQTAVIFNDTIRLYHNAPGSPSIILMQGTGELPTITYPDTITVSKSITFPDVTSSASYRLVGLPGNNDLSISQFVGSGDAGKEWNAYLDNGANTNYFESYSAGSTKFNFKPGNGFWLLSKNGFNVSSRNVTSVPLATDNSYSITLNAGWNIISNPFDKAVLWSNIKAFNNLPANASIYSWAGSYPFPGATVMQPYEGYYYRNDAGAGAIIKIPFIPASGIAREQDNNTSFGEKHIRIELVRQGEILGTVAAAFAQSASLGMDDIDIIAPPGDFEVSGLRIINNSFPERSTQLFVEARNISEVNHEFAFTTRKMKNIEASLRFTRADEFQNEVYLYDTEMEMLYNVKEGADVAVPAYSTVRQYRLILGTSDFIQQKKSEITPLQTRLMQNFPNPFTRTTVLRYSIADEGRVTIKLFDILGREAGLLLDEYAKPGSYEIVFSGEKLAGGVYLCELVSGKTRSMIKATIIK
ncbi:MAG: choice-of-anchor D domain-containing protein [Ignavibacteriaceae bacterium]|nr:choice-of-anchor D domain-containing protein [Ignavibacteriaceae bacterium]